MWNVVKKETVINFIHLPKFTGMHEAYGNNMMPTFPSLKEKVKEKCKIFRLCVADNGVEICGKFSDERIMKTKP